jgi:Domain of unknown function (DUF4166)
MTSALKTNANPAPSSSTTSRRVGSPEIGDLRFRALLTDDAWASLPPAVRKRFSKRLSGGATAIYSGRVTEIWVSKLGRVLAQIPRVIGAPLPLSSAVNAATVVTVTEDAASGGQNWTRLFTRDRGFPQIIHSVKRFSGPTGLEEYIGFGIAMALSIGVESGALVFRSARYCLAFRNWRVPLPRWVTPGELTVSHKEVTPTSFLFTLHLEHGLFGTLVHQEALYDEERP